MFTDVLTWVLSLGIHLLNFIIKALGSVLSLISMVLPNTPFSTDSFIFDESLLEVIGYLNYLLPIKEIISIGMAWIACVGVYIIYSIVLRWVKAIE